MKKIIVSLAVLFCVGNVMAQTPEEKAALKEAKKEAKTCLAEAQKIKEELEPKIQDKTVDEKVLLEKYGKAIDLVYKAFKTNTIEEKKYGETYKLLSDLALPVNNVFLFKASNKQAFDTLYFYNNLKTLTESLHKELKYTKPTSGEYGNEAVLKSKKDNLANCGVYYIYAAQFTADINRADLALEAYDTAMNYEKNYPEIAGMSDMRISEAQMAYYAFHTAHNAKMFDAMDKYYEKALQFAEGAEGVKQVKVMSYLEKGDSVAWANYLRETTLKDPVNNTDYIQMLLAYYQKSGMDKMVEYADAVLAVDPNVYIANYGKAYVLFATNKYDDALVLYKKCAEIKSDSYDSWYQCGLCKYRQALDLNNTISSIKNRVKAQETLEKTKTLFAEALPFFEKARECMPDDPEKWAYELKQCYTVTGNAAKASEMSKLIGE